MPKGSRPGERRGGRQKGTPNRVSKNTILREAIRSVIKEGETPLEYLLRIMRDPNENDARRLDAAKAAVAFVHPKLATVMHQGDDQAPLTVREVYTGVPRVLDDEGDDDGKVCH